MDYRIIQLEEKITQNLKFDWNIEKMAEISNISKEHFHKLFKKEVGKPPIQYLRELRLAKAKELLESTNLRVKEIIGEVGINDQTHFVRDFKKVYGLTPNQFRQNHWDNIQAVKAKS